MSKKSKVKHIHHEPSWEPVEQFKLTKKQIELIKAIETHDVTFALGGAGNGKTLVCIKAAVEALNKGTVRKIVLTRPAVEAFESLGFLPGTLQEKVTPYLLPMYEALSDLMGHQELQKLREHDKILISPLAFMRGTTFRNSFIVLDEAQNTTSEQMKMFLTRLGKGSKMAITADPSQVDLPNKNKSGLLKIAEILSDVPAVAFVQFNAEDTVRHQTVKDIVNAYDKYEHRQ